MAYKGVIDDIRKCVAPQKPSRIPVFACSEEFDVRMAVERFTRLYGCSEKGDRRQGLYSWKRRSDKGS